MIGFGRGALWGAMVAAAAALVACDGHKPAKSEQPVDTTAISRPPPAPAMVEDSDLPGIPADYALARTELLRRGLTLAPDKPEHPSPQFPDMSCDPDTGLCEALFLERDAEGWRRYVVVEAVGAPPTVTSVKYPPTARGLPAIPPPPPADAPKLTGHYGSVRSQLLALGYQPSRAAVKPFRVCARELSSGEYLECEADTELPEIANCSGTGMGFCTAYWIAPDRRVLAITTIGEPQPGGLYHVAWAKPTELAELPPGWQGP